MVGEVLHGCAGESPRTRIQWFVARPSLAVAVYGQDARTTSGSRFLPKSRKIAWRA